LKKDKGGIFGFGILQDKSLKNERIDPSTSIAADLQTLVGKRVTSAHYALEDINHRFELKFNDGTILTWTYEVSEGNTTIK